MIRAMIELAEWLEAQNLPTSGTKVVIELPDADAADKARHAVLNDPILFGMSYVAEHGKRQFMLIGMDIEFRPREPQ